MYQGSDEPYLYVGGAIGEETGTSILRNDKGDEMTVLKQHRESMKIMDTENAIVNEFVAITGEVEGQYIEKVDDDGNSFHALYWFDDEYGYQITGECPREDILRIAKGLCS